MAEGNKEYVPGPQSERSYTWRLMNVKSENEKAVAINHCLCVASWQVPSQAVAVLPVRICHCEGDDESPLITPCRCTGTLRFVHQACLHQWIKSSDTRCCELCKYDFIMETKLKPLRKVRCFWI